MVVRLRTLLCSAPRPPLFRLAAPLDEASDIPTSSEPSGVLLPDVNRSFRLSLLDPPLPPLRAPGAMLEVGERGRVSVVQREARNYRDYSVKYVLCPGRC